jgi:hypothetical protein
MQVRYWPRGCRIVAPSGTGVEGMAELPSGTATFLLTDVEGSTALWKEAPEAMRVALARGDMPRLLAAHQVSTMRGTAARIGLYVHT